MSALIAQSTRLAQPNAQDEGDALALRYGAEVSLRGARGLGLSVARHWIRQHGGRLRLDSFEGEGTRAAVDLPLAPIVPPPDAATQERT